VLRTPLEVRRALVYVLHNHRHHHSGSGRPSRFDPFSSATYFCGFMIAVPPRPRDECIAPPETPVAVPRTWLMRQGWRLHGLISPAEEPS
jgi:hypothetical protein